MTKDLPLTRSVLAAKIATRDVKFRPNEAM